MRATWNWSRCLAWTVDSIDGDRFGAANYMFVSRQMQPRSCFFVFRPWPLRASGTVQESPDVWQPFPLEVSRELQVRYEMP